MRIYSVMFGSATAPLSLPSLTVWWGAAKSFAVGVRLPRPGRHVARFAEIIVFAISLALMALSAPASAQSFTISSVTASPATVQPGQTVTFSAKITASQNASNYPVEFSLMFNGQSVTQKVFYLTFKPDAISVQAYSWTVPAGTGAGTYSMVVAVFNPTWSSMLATKSAALTIAAATVGSGAAPVLLELPVVSGTAQVGHALASTTGTWTGATSFAYQWSGNKAPIAGATAATYVPVSSDVGHTLTSTVVATGSSGAKSSATSAATVPIVAATPNSPPVTAAGSAPFVALHTYYMSPTGSDSNNGLTAATAWATPNHAVNCGDVIIAAAGSYASMSHWGTVSACPSTSGGIDGKGGVYFATVLCGGPSVGACYITTRATATAFEVTASNWAVEGWLVNTSAKYRAFESYACTYSGGMKHHIAFINDISANNLDAADTDDCGQAHSTSVPSTVGVDYFATVGMIAQNSAQDPICLAAIDVVGPGVLDINAGTHYFIYGNFSYANQNTHCRSMYDTEDYMFDTWDAHNVTTQGVIANNIGFDADRMCIQLVWQNLVSDAATIKIYNNTCFKNNNYTGGDYMDGEINLGSHANNMPYVTTVQNNLAYQPLSISSGGGAVAAFAQYFTINKLTNGGSGTENFFRANNSSCKLAHCNSTYDAEASGLVANLGTNTYTNPAFANTTDLLANRVGVPNCSGYTTTTACMGWDANTRTLTTPSIISDLVPAASGTSGKGYQKPSTTCAANADYPTWLKGIVYLQWNGSTLTENGDLVTKPCNM